MTDQECRNNRRTEDHHEGVLAPPPRPHPYRKPQVIVIGSPVATIRQDITGHLRDGVDGWWVWSS